MIGRIVWTFGLIVIGLVTTGLQLDRQSEPTPQLAPAVPAPLRSYAQAIIAAQAVAGKDSAAALSAAQELVRRRPMPAENLTILAIAQAKAGDNQKAALSIQLAGKRGWREALAQEAVLGLALDAGDKPEAARRYAALFRSTATPNDKLIALAPLVLGEPRGPGQETFATVMAGAEPWHSQFLERARQVLPPAMLADVLELAFERRARFPCAPVADAIEPLRKHDAARADRLAALARKTCR
jgi:predicted protein tyrosine phosphatase